MNQATVLELQFKDGEGKNRKITIKHPQLNLDQATVLATMQTIVDTNIFYTDKGADLFASVVGARYVTRSVAEVCEAQPRENA